MQDGEEADGEYVDVAAMMARDSPLDDIFEAPSPPNEIRRDWRTQDHDIIQAKLRDTREALRRGESVGNVRVKSCDSLFDLGPLDGGSARWLPAATLASLTAHAFQGGRRTTTFSTTLATL